MGSLAPAAWDLTGSVTFNGPVSSGLIRLDLELPRPVSFAPGQFAMLNLRGVQQLIFRRPFSILSVDDRTISFLYRVVGRGTALLAALEAGEEVDCLAPLGRPFPLPDSSTPPVVVLAGGVGLPPLHAWYAAHGRPGDLACFGGRDGRDVPWTLLDDTWRVSVDRGDGIPQGREAHEGLVIDLVQHLPDELTGGPRLVLACGPTPLLRAAAILSQERSWGCYVSLEEHMGCGYGVCKGCVVPVISSQDPGWRNVTSCTEGPVFDAADLEWSRFGYPSREEAR